MNNWTLQVDRTGLVGLQHRCPGDGPSLGMLGLLRIGDCGEDFDTLDATWFPPSISPSAGLLSQYRPDLQELVS